MQFFLHQDKQHCHVAGSFLVQWPLCRFANEKGIMKGTWSTQFANLLFKSFRSLFHVQRPSKNLILVVEE